MKLKYNHFILEEFSQAVINCAGLTKIDDCESNKDLAKELNESLPKRLAQLCFHVGGKLIHFSTDMIIQWEKRKIRTYRSTKSVEYLCDHQGRW
jgi:dTDP-4-dehydrorhamnose reductase